MAFRFPHHALPCSQSHCISSQRWQSTMVLSMERWKGKVAVVTGASEGIGAGIAKALVENGLIVAGFARRKEKVEQLAATLKDPSKLRALRVDVTKEQDVLDGFRWVEENLGPVHVLVNNAGVLPNSDLTDGTTESWRRTFDTNVLGLCVATREALKVFEENEIDGHVVHINSIAGHKVLAFPGTSVYSATKFAVTALTETLRQELNSKGSKTKVTSVSPGYVRTDIFGAAGMDVGETENRLGSNVQPMRPEDIADAVLYALSTPPHVQVHELTLRPVGQII